MAGIHPTLPIPGHLPRTKEAPVQDIALTAPAPGTEPTRSPEEEARDILATAAKNQAEDGPNTRRAAVRACKYLRAMVNQYESTIQEVHKAARIHTQMSKGTAGATADYRPQGGALPVISPELTSELLHCLSTLPDPWPLAKITIDMEKPSQWVSKLCRLYFADEYARRTVGLPLATHVPDIETALLFCGRRPLPFGGSHLRLPSGPAGIRTTTGSLSALARPTPYQLSHRVA